MIQTEDLAQESTGLESTSSVERDPSGPMRNAVYVFKTADFDLGPGIDQRIEPVGVDELMGWPLEDICKDIDEIDRKLGSTGNLSRLQELPDSQNVDITSWSSNQYDFSEQSDSTLSSLEKKIDERGLSIRQRKRAVRFHNEPEVSAAEQRKNALRVTTGIDLTQPEQVVPAPRIIRHDKGPKLFVIWSRKEELEPRPKSRPLSPSPAKRGSDATMWTSYEDLALETDYQFTDDEDYMVPRDREGYDWLRPPRSEGSDDTDTGTDSSGIPRFVNALTRRAMRRTMSNVHSIKSASSLASNKVNPLERSSRVGSVTSMGDAKPATAQEKTQSCWCIRILRKTLCAKVKPTPHPDVVPERKEEPSAPIKIHGILKKRRDTPVVLRLADVSEHEGSDITMYSKESTPELSRIGTPDVSEIEGNITSNVEIVSLNSKMRMRRNTPAYIRHYNPKELNGNVFHKECLLQKQNGIAEHSVAETDVENKDDRELNGHFLNVNIETVVDKEERKDTSVKSLKVTEIEGSSSCESTSITKSPESPSGKTKTEDDQKSEQDNQEVTNEEEKDDKVQDTNTESQPEVRKTPSFLQKRKWSGTFKFKKNRSTCRRFTFFFPKLGCWDENLEMEHLGNKEREKVVVENGEQRREDSYEVDTNEVNDRRMDHAVVDSGRVDNTVVNNYMVDNSRMDNKVVNNYEVNNCVVDSNCEDTAMDNSKVDNKVRDISWIENNSTDISTTSSKPDNRLDNNTTDNQATQYNRPANNDIPNEVPHDIIDEQDTRQTPDRQILGQILDELERPERADDRIWEIAHIIQYSQSDNQEGISVSSSKYRWADSRADSRADSLLDSYRDSQSRTSSVKCAPTPVD